MLLRGARGPPDPGLLHRVRVPAARPRRAGARARRRGRTARSTLPSLQADVNLGRGRLEAMLKVLDVEGAVRREGSGWVATGDAVGVRRAALRAGHRAAPRRAGGDARLRRRRPLPDAGAAGRARRPARRAVRALLGLRRAALRRAGRRRRSRARRDRARAQPAGRADRAQADAADRRRPGQADPARAAARGGPRARARRRRRLGRARARGPPRRALRRRARRGVRRPACDRWQPSPAPAWVTAVPSRRTGDLVPDLARRLAAALELPYVDAARAGRRQPAPARDGELRPAGGQRPRAVPVAGAATGGPGLLVDDLRYSGWTLATVGAQLRKKGAGPLHPLVLSLAGA